MNPITVFKAIFVGVALLLFSGVCYIVSEIEQVIVTQFGKPVSEPVTAAGLHFKLPMIQQVNRLEKRILEWDGPSAEMPTKDKLYVVVDAFDPETDIDAWLEVNNRAFADHPEQGGWDAARFATRRAEPWFRAEDLRVARRDGRVVGSCWTKRSDDPGRPPIGEIHVIGVDPSAQGIGLGPAIVTEGLHHLATVCGAEIGMLYVDADNTAAVRLYERLGFRPVREDHAYEDAIA